MHLHFFDALKKKHSDLKFYKEIALSNEKYIKFNGSLTIIHLNADIKPCVFIMAQSQQQLNSLKVEQDKGIFIYSTGNSINYSHQKPIGFFNKLKFLFSNNTQVVNQSENGPIIYICCSQLPSTKIIGSCLFEAKNIKQDDLEIHLNGSGCLNLKGKVVNFRSNLKGSGFIDAQELYCLNLNAVVDGSGSLEAYVNHSVDLELSGSGLITIDGNPPNTSFKKSGSGQISCPKRKV